MKHLADHIFKEFYQKQIMEKPGMRTFSYNGFIQVFHNANLE